MGISYQQFLCCSSKNF